MLKRYLLIGLCLIMIYFIPTQVWAEEEKNEQEQAMIIEVEGNPETHADYISTHQPDIEIISIYHLLFNGLAMKGPPEKLTRLSSLDFVKAIHPVRDYKINETSTNTSPIISMDDIKDMEQVDAVTPDLLNDTSYTGKGVKVGVIDTGIDYDHPDLQKNYQGGYDLVDLDDDPMETKPEQGIPTHHGSHVAGIIAGSGTLTGVAPEADIYSYRALGPGGVGSSVQIIAAMEQAVQDGVDVINLSLGNDINGPDYPTSAAVNKAIELGLFVVIANGNSGPGDWTVGSPATATKALSIGALQQEKQVPQLYEPRTEQTITPRPLIGSVPWELTKDYPVTADTTELAGKIALIERGGVSFYESAIKAEQQGAEAVLIYNDSEEPFQGSIANSDKQVNIPVSQITKEEGEWLLEESQQSSLYLDTIYNDQPMTVAEFSSRGPVTVNWDIKPDVIAPGTDVLSTVPGGYQILQGTSMAAPHAAGVIALMKEAKPDWSNEQIIGALKTTAKQVVDENNHPDEPISQGTGLVQPKEALDTGTILSDSTLSFGEFNQNERTQTVEFIVENTTDDEQHYSFNIPTKTKGVSWSLPQSFALKKHEKKSVSVDLAVNPLLKEEGIHQGWLTLEENTQSDTYHLPYLYMNGTADHPKAMGFNFSLKPLSSDEFQYQIYLTDQTEAVDVHLYNPDTLVYDRPFLHLDHPDVGLNEGEMEKKELGEPGVYLAIITVELENGDIESYESRVMIDPSW